MLAYIKKKNHENIASLFDMIRDQIRKLEITPKFWELAVFYYGWDLCGGASGWGSLLETDISACRKYTRSGCRRIRRNSQ